MSKRCNRGFSLLELAVVLVIIGTIAGLSVSVGVTQMAAAEISSTKQQLNNLKRAMLLFHEKQGRFPCPADGDVEVTNTNYGVEAATNCATTTPSSITETNGNLIGSVPFKTLGVSEEETIDPWGYRVSYIIDKAQTETINLSAGSIIIQDINGNEILQSPGLGDAIFAFISHGEDGNGAWPELGGSASCTSGARDSENCDHAADVILTSGNITDTDITANQYDDVIVWYSLAEKMTNGILDEFNYLAGIDIGSTTCAINQSGELWCWGHGAQGALGIPSPPSYQADPIQVTSISEPWLMVAGDSYINCGVTISGKGYCWGRRDEGILGDGGAATGSEEELPVAIDSHDEDGDLIGTWKEVYVEYIHACGVATSGYAYCWGDDHYQALGNGAGGDTNSPDKVLDDTGSSAWNDWITIAPSSIGTCGIRNSGGGTTSTQGTLWCWGNNSNGEVETTTSSAHALPVQRDTNIDWTYVSGDDGNFCATRAGGDLYCWGSNNHGQIAGVPTSTTRVTAPYFIGSNYSIAVPDCSYICAVQNGVVKCWGEDRAGSQGNGTGTSDVLTPTAVGGTAAAYNDFFSIGSGCNKVCAMRENGEVHCWGYGNNRNFGNGTSNLFTEHDPILAAGGMLFD